MPTSVIQRLMGQLSIKISIRNISASLSGSFELARAPTDMSVNRPGSASVPPLPPPPRGNSIHRSSGLRSGRR